MNYMNRRKKSVWLGILVVCYAVIFPMHLNASEKIKLTIDFDNSDPVEYRAPIMAISHSKAQLVVAEETIFVVDVMIGEYRFATEVTDAKGKPKPLASFKRGDFVYVKGFKGPDGVVFASSVQKVKAR